MIWLSVAIGGVGVLVLLIACYGISGEPLNPSETTEEESCTK